MENSAGVIGKAIALMNYMAQEGKPCGVSDLSRELDMPKATVHRVLGMLCCESAAVKDEDGRYRIGPCVLLWSEGYRAGSGIVELVRPWLEKLSKLSRETIHLSVYEHGMAYYAARIDSTQNIGVVLRWSHLGTTLPLYCTAAGRSILASLSEDELSAYFHRTDMKKRTDRTETSEDALRKMLDKVRAQGYAEENQENEENIRCVGAAIINRDSRPIAAISMTAPTFRFTDYDSMKYGEAIAGMAREISAML